MNLVDSGIFPAEGQRMGEFLGRLWMTACRALSISDEHARHTTQCLHDLLPSWADEPIGDLPRRPSYVAEDGFPAEMSVNWSGKHPELRVLFDCLFEGERGYDLRPADSAERGTTSLTAVSARFRQVSEIFTPRAGRPSVAPLWHSMAWRPPGPVHHKTYFGLYQWSVEQRHAAVEQAMARLGMAAAWADARERVERGAGGRGHREIEFFALDLDDTATARVKVYYRNHDADIDELNRMAAVAASHDAGRARTAYRTLVAGDDAGEAALTCLAFRAGHNRAAEASTYLRVRERTSCGREAVDRTAALLEREGVDPLLFRTLAIAWGVVDGRTLLELVSHRTARGLGDVTTYFRFPVYRNGTPVNGSRANQVGNVAEPASLTATGGKESL